MFPLVKPAVRATLLATLVTLGTGAAAPAMAAPKKVCGSAVTDWIKGKGVTFIGKAALTDTGAKQDVKVQFSKSKVKMTLKKTHGPSGFTLDRKTGTMTWPVVPKVRAGLTHPSCERAGSSEVTGAVFRTYTEGGKVGEYLGIVIRQR
jgi:hypothetical protein